MWKNKYFTDNSVLIKYTYNQKKRSLSNNITSYSNDTNDFYSNIDGCNPNKIQKILILFDDVFVDILDYKKLN